VVGWVGGWVGWVGWVGATDVELTKRIVGLCISRLGYGCKSRVLIP